MPMLKQNKGAPTETETGRDAPTRGDKLAIGCVGSLAPGKEGSQAQGAFLHGQADVQRLCT